MKLALISFAVGSLALIGAAHAQPGAGSDWYVREDVGGSFQGEINRTPKVRGKSGWAVEAALGRSFAPNVRREAELRYSDSDAKVGDGRIKTVAGLLNGYYDFSTGTALRPFVGAGLGVGQVKLDGGPLRAGVGYPVNDRLCAQVA